MDAMLSRDHVVVHRPVQHPDRGGLISRTFNITVLPASLARPGVAVAHGAFAFTELACVKGDVQGEFLTDDSGLGASFGAGYLFADLVGAELGCVSFGELTAGRRNSKVTSGLPGHVSMSRSAMASAPSATLACITGTLMSPMGALHPKMVVTSISVLAVLMS